MTVRAGAGGTLLTSTLRSSNVLLEVGRPNFPGVGGLSVATISIDAALASFAGASSLALSSSLALAALANFSGVGSLAADTIKSPSLANFAGAGALSGHLETFLFDSLEAFAGTGFLSTNLLTYLFDLSENLAGSATLSSHLEVFSFVNPATFVGSSSLIANLTQGSGAKQGSGTFTGVGSLTGSVGLLAGLFSTFGGVGALSGILNNVLAVGANFAGNSSLTINFVDISRIAVFGGVGGLSLTTWQAMSAFWPGVGVGGLRAYAALIQPIYPLDPEFDGMGSLIASSALARWFAGSTLGGAGRLRASAYVQLRPKGPVDNVVVSGPGAVNNVVV